MSRRLLLVEGDSIVAKPGADVCESLRDLGWDVNNQAAKYGDTCVTMAWGAVKRLEPAGPPGMTALGTWVYEQPQTLDFADVMRREAARGKVPVAILISAGGNDLLQAFPTLLRDAGRNGPPLSTTRLVSLCADIAEDLSHVVIKAQGAAYEIFPEIKQVPVILLGYPTPRPGMGGWLGGLVGPWLAPLLIARHYGTESHAQEREQIVHHAINELHKSISTVAKSTGSIYLDCRPLVTPEQMGDEIHPTRQGCDAIARAIGGLLISMQEVVA